MKILHRSDGVPLLTCMPPWMAFHLFNAVCTTGQRNICQSNRVAAGRSRPRRPPAKGTRWKSLALLHDTAEIWRDQHLPALDSRPDEKLLEASQQIARHKLVSRLGRNYPSCGIFRTSHFLCPHHPSPPGGANMIAYVCAYSMWPHESVRVCMCVTVCVIITYPKL